MTGTALDHPPIPEAEALAIAEGRHADPFDVLGPRDFAAQTWITALDPGADQLFAVVDGEEHALPRLHGPVFSGPVPACTDYRLKGLGGDGAEWTYDDAYRFGPVLSDFDEYLLGEGTHLRLWEALGAHVLEHEGVLGTHFAVWAPNALRVSVVGAFNHWDGRRHVMRRRGGTGVWEIFLPNVGHGAAYKFEIMDRHGGLLPQKADPVGFGAEHPPQTASIVRDLSGYDWGDQAWMKARAARNRRDAPISVYEVHLGSWKRVWDQGGRPLSYREAAKDLVSYAKDMGFTHIELMPVSEFPFDGSWGYQPVGLFAPTVRFGTPSEFKALVDEVHAADMGLLIDWVPGHFPTDPHGLGRFDGTALYEHEDPREGFHQDWNTLIYNYGRCEVSNFLTANALYWLEEYHVDGLRVDAVASMLYRDYSRAEGEWVPNQHGGRENLEAIDFMRRMNTESYGAQPGIMTVAEESTAYPGVSAPVDAGGLGFGYKWNMGWMNDTLDYISREPVHRKFHHHQITNTISWAFSENFILPISHDEVVHGKGSMWEKMPGDDWQKSANLRAYYGYMWGHPGKKLLFQGTEFGQPSEWDHDAQVDWDACYRAPHAGIRALVRDLNHAYRSRPALHARDCEPEGFQWIDANNAEDSVLAFCRHGRDGDAPVLVVCNFTPVERGGYRIGVPSPGHWREFINTDSKAYGGEDRGNLGGVDADKDPMHGQPHSLLLTLPPLSTLMFSPG